MIRFRAALAAAPVLALALAAAPVAAEGDIEIPAFARKYGVSCSLCHAPAPRLTKFGETFAGNGFELRVGEEPPDTMATGDPLLRLHAWDEASTGVRLATDSWAGATLSLRPLSACSPMRRYSMFQVATPAQVRAAESEAV